MSNCCFGKYLMLGDLFLEDEEDRNKETEKSKYVYTSFYLFDISMKVFLFLFLRETGKNVSKPCSKNKE